MTSVRPTPSRVRILADAAALFRAAADDFAAIARDATAARGVFHVALAGGSTPKQMFAELAARGRDALPWDHIVLWFGDERTVPPDHPDSNYGMARATLIEPLGLDPARVHRMRGEADPDAAARDYERALVEALGAPPVLDLVLLGLGPDGHTASLFPGSPALAETRRWVVANPVDSPVAHGKTVRITLTVPAINAARHVRFLVAGADKAAILAEVCNEQRGRYPAERIAPASGDREWLVDAPAATVLCGDGT